MYLQMTVSPQLRGQYWHLEKGRYNGEEPRYGRVRRCAVFGRAFRFGTVSEGKPRTDVDKYHTSTLDTMVEDIGTVGPLVADKEWQAMARSKAKEKGFPAIRLS